MRRLWGLSAPASAWIPALAVTFLLARLLEFVPGLETPAGALMLVFASVAPGWLFVHWLVAEARHDPGRTLLLSLALSPCWLTAGTATLVFAARLSLEASAQVAVWAIFLALVGEWVRSRMRGSRSRVDSPSGALPASWTWAALAPVLIMVCLAAAVFVPTGNRLAYHGLLHAGIAAQIFAGLIPPENPALAGQPLEFYWLYHWLLAVYSQLSGFSLLTHAPWIHLSTLLVYVGVSYRLARRFCSARKAGIAALAIGFVGNLCFPILFAANALGSGLPELPPYWPMRLIQVGWLGGDPRLATLLAKFLTAGGFSMGLALWAVLLDEAVPAEGRLPRRSVIAVTLCGIVMFHTPTALAAFPALALAHLSQGFDRLSNLSLSTLWRANWRMGLVFLAALLLTAPYLASVASGSQGASAFSPPAAGVLAYNAKGILLSATPLLPILLGSVVGGWSDRRVRFLLLACATPLLMGALLSLPDLNQYKFVHIAALPGGALLVWLLRDREDTRRSIALSTAWALVLLLSLASHAITAASHFVAISSQRDQFRGDGGYLSFPADPDLNGVLHWLRESTPVEAVVISKPIPFARSRVKAVAGRGDYVLLGGHHTDGNLTHALRYGLVRRLFDPEQPLRPILRKITASIDRPLYLLVERSQFPESFPALIRRFDAGTYGLVPLRRSDGVVLYAVRRGSRRN